MDNNRSSAQENLWEILYTHNGLKGFMEQEGFVMSKALGQNFLINPKVMNAVLQACNFPRVGTVIEIGPGIGHLTWLLIHRGLNVIAIEKDRLFAQRLPQWRDQWKIDESCLSVIHQDVLDSPIRTIAEQNDVRHVIGNLPYNVSVPILFHLSYCGYAFDDICVMVQKEVGERILAQEGNKTYGRLSIVLKYLFTIEKIMTITPGAFFPQPRVDSVFLKLTPKPEVNREFAQQFLERAVHIGFLHRRKKIRTNMQGSLIEKRIMNDLLPDLEKSFNLDKRAEDWSVEEWVRFASFLRDCPPAE